MLVSTSLIASALALVNVAQASPLASRSTSAPPAKYHLQTQLRGDSSKSDAGTPKGGLWLYSYHTGAGLGDAVLDSDKSVAMEAYYNKTDSQQYFTYPNNEIGGWPLAIQYGPYQSFQTVTISIADEPDSSGFFFNSTGLQWNTTSFTGWLACDWWHGSPQLFAELEYSYGDLPKTCSKVDLMPVAY